MNISKFIKATLHQKTSAGFAKANKTVELLLPIEAIAALKKFKENYYEVYLKSEYKIKMDFEYEVIHASLNDSKIEIL